MDWLISSAHAQAAGAAQPQGGGMQFFIMMAGFIVIFYLMIIRPQSKRAKEMKAMIAGITVGDEIATSGGILGKVTEVSDQFLTVEIADGVAVKIQRHTVQSVLPKGTLKSA